MIDDRFSDSQFSALGLDSDDARCLADELAVEIQAEVHECVPRKMSEIADRLNGLGHHLELEVAVPGEISFWDVRKGGAGEERCHLRMGLDSVVSTGYAHMISEREAWSVLERPE